jgi:hypothetical protein
MPGGHRIRGGVFICYRREAPSCVAAQVISTAIMWFIHHRPPGGLNFVAWIIEGGTTEPRRRWQRPSCENSLRDAR